MSNYMSSSEVTFWETITGKFLYTRLAIVESLTRVETVKGFEKILGITLKSTAI